MNEPYLKIIGSSPAWINADEACSSYLLGGMPKGPVLMDLGTGALMSLAREKEAKQQLAGIVLTHAHADHAFDLIPLAYDLQFGPRSDWGKLPLYLTEDSLNRLKQISSALGAPDKYWSDTFTINIYDPGDSFTVGDWNITTADMPHFIPTCALRAQLPDGKSVTYSADVGQGGMNQLAAFAKQTELFVCEAALPVLCPDDHLARTGHIDPLEAATVAREADAKQLILTHIPSNYLPELALEQARAVVEMPVGLAGSGETYLL